MRFFAFNPATANARVCQAILMFPANLDNDHHQLEYLFHFQPSTLLACLYASALFYFLIDDALRSVRTLASSLK